MTALHRFAAVALVCMAVPWFVPSSIATAQSPAPATAQQYPVLRIATGEAPPFVLHQGDILLIRPECS